MLPLSRPVTVSRRSTGMPSARLADSRRTRRSPPEQGRPPLFRAVTAASQSMGCHQGALAGAVFDEPAFSEQVGPRR